MDLEKENQILAKKVFDLTTKLDKATNIISDYSKQIAIREASIKLMANRISTLTQENEQTQTELHELQRKFKIFNELLTR